MLTLEVWFWGTVYVDTNYFQTMDFAWTLATRGFVQRLAASWSHAIFIHVFPRIKTIWTCKTLQVQRGMHMYKWIFEISYINIHKLHSYVALVDPWHHMASSPAGFAHGMPRHRHPVGWSHWSGGPASWKSTRGQSPATRGHSSCEDQCWALGGWIWESGPWQVGDLVDDHFFFCKKTV